MVDAQEILSALALGEARDWEFKSAQGGLPASLWETYSAMANTEGGAIVLGVKPKGETYVVVGIHDPAKTKRDFWNTINNRGKVSANLLTDRQVYVKAIGADSILVIEVPRASRAERPVYVGQNPLEGTYRRNFEGDYHCTRKEVARLLADSSDEPADCRILEHFTLDDLDAESLRDYRQRFSARAPTHAWLGQDLQGLLEKLGGWRRDRANGREGLTVAGLLMFGRAEAIHDPLAVPEFHLDYRERFSDDPGTRWTDRLTLDGTWAGNVYQFYRRVVHKLTADLRIPFRLEADLFRRDDTIVHEAIREGLVNALVHADYQGQGGIIVEKYVDHIEMSNPGTLLVSFEQLLSGGVSECRNKALQTMFQMIGGGEKAGSGVDKIRTGWSSQNWRSPRYSETVQPDRVRLVLPMVSMLPEDSVARLEEQFGRRFTSLSPLEVQALVTAELEDGVSNSRMQEISSEHPADLTRMLQGLVGKGCLRQLGQKRGAVYRLPEHAHRGGTTLAHEQCDSLHKPADSLHKDVDSLHSGRGISQEEFAHLDAIAAPGRSRRRLPPQEMRKLVCTLCRGRYLSAAALGELLGRSPTGLQYRILRPMVTEGLLVLRYPESLNRPDQAYTTRTRERRL